MCQKVLTNSVSVLRLSVGDVRNISYSNYFRFKIVALLGWTLELWNRTPESIGSRDDVLLLSETEK